MTKVFVDTGFWLALAHNRDQHHQLAKQLREEHSKSVLVTTDECLTEFLSHMREPTHRMIAAKLVHAIRNNQLVIVKPQSRVTFDTGLAEYEKFQDKSWSLVDCVSFTVMREEHINDALAHDKDFSQAGFNALMRVQ